MKSWKHLSSVAAIACAVTFVAIAEEPKPAAPDAAQQNATQMMMEMGTPGDHHAHMDQLVGEWDMDCKFWMAGPDAEPMVTTGKMTREMILGGRYLTEHYSGNFGGMPFEGHGLMAYDNMQKKYIGLWIDSMSTAIFREMGTCDDAGKVFTFYGENPDPETGGKKMKKTKSIITIKDKDNHKMEAYTVTPEGEFKMMELVAKRSSSSKTAQPTES
ncbi:MAG: DUF1579 domain-containing protein [Phycisphaerae bacterium]